MASETKTGDNCKTEYPPRRVRAITALTTLAVNGGWEMDVLRSTATHDSINAKDSADVHTGIDVAATVERVKDDTVLALVRIVDDHRLVKLLRHKHRRPARRAQGVDHDVVREHIELLLLLALHVRLARQADSARDQSVEGRVGKGRV